MTSNYKVSEDSVVALATETAGGHRVLPPAIEGAMLMLKQTVLCVALGLSLGISAGSIADVHSQPPVVEEASWKDKALGFVDAAKARGSNLVGTFTSDERHGRAKEEIEAMRKQIADLNQQLMAKEIRQHAQHLEMQMCAGKVVEYLNSFKEVSYDPAATAQ